ncbi:thioredoxin [Lentisphaera profundi]|uniref:Thioredoxin n=1 Tax=Lentisphaera profundi TaxID=1658616 RepID=A0ABY7VNS6_9BACT|nr:thioredoxin [Lentisphaera profundi]WDE95329.1 thioredoxin [Lentisphaera profundi]
MKLKAILLTSVLLMTLNLSAADKNVVDLTDKDFKENVIQQKGIVLVDFHATWCGPCKQLSPEIHKLAETYKGKAKIVKVDVDKAPKISKQYNIQYIPHVLLFKDGKLVKVVEGRDAKSIGKDIEAAMK